MIRHQKRTISAEDEDLVVGVTSSTVEDNTTPTLNTNQDVLLTVHYRDFWKEEKEQDLDDSTITIPLSEYVTRLHLNENYYTKTQVNQFIENYGIKTVVLQSKNDLPTANDSNYGNASYIFFIRHNNAGDDDVYDEYIWDSSTNKYEKIGSTSMDLEPYMTKALFNTWKTDTYTPFVTSTNDSISSLGSTKADTTYVDSKILSEAERIINLIASEFDTNTITNDIEDLLDGFSSSLDGAIDAHNVDPQSHLDIRSLIANKDITVTNSSTGIVKDGIYITRE